MSLSQASDNQSEISTHPNVWLMVFVGTGEDIVKRTGEAVNTAAEKVAAFNDTWAALIESKGIKETASLAEIKNAEDELVVLLTKLLKDPANNEDEYLTKLREKFSRKVSEDSDDEFTKLLISFFKEMDNDEFTKQVMQFLVYLQDDGELSSSRRLEKARNMAIEKLSQGFLTTSYYVPPKVKDIIGKISSDDKSGKRTVFRFLPFQGVGTKHANPINMDTKGRMRGSSHFAEKRGYATGAGEKQNVSYAMRLLADADKRDELPERIILNAHSRGSVATIELARAIYLEYGDRIKIAMNIADPVPGPLRLRQSKMVIPPNVDSLVITYAENPMSSSLVDKLFIPQDLSRILFDPAKTTVTTTTFPVSHMLTTDDKKVTSDTEAAFGSINAGLVQAVAGKETVDIQMADSVRRDLTKQPEGGVRKGRAFIVATDPDLNRNLPESLKEFHSKLRETAYTHTEQLGNFKAENRSMVSRAVESINDDDKKGRELILSKMYQFGKLSLNNDTLHSYLIKNDKKYKKWHHEMGAYFKSEQNTERLKEYIKINKDKLDRNISSLEKIIKKGNGSKKNETQRRKLQALKQARHMIENIKVPPQNDNELASYYLGLRHLQNEVKTFQPSFLQKAKFILFQSNKSHDLITPLINGMILNMMNPSNLPVTHDSINSPKSQSK